jgi:hypothetical protein
MVTQQQKICRHPPAIQTPDPDHQATFNPVLTKKEHSHGHSK